MSKVFVIHPKGGWHPGDRAYCIEGTRRTTPTLEAGKVYDVESVLPAPNMVGEGLVLRGVTPPDGLKGFYSSRFARLPAGERPAAALAKQITRGWHDAYKASTGYDL